MHTTATRTTSGQSTQFNDEGEAKDGTRHTSNVSRCTSDVGVSHVLELVSLTMAAMDSGDSDGYGGSDGSKDRVSNDAAKSVKDPSGYDDSSWHGAQGLNAWRGWRWVMAAVVCVSRNSGPHQPMGRGLTPALRRSRGIGAEIAISQHDHCSRRPPLRV